MLLVFTAALKGVGFNFKMWESRNLPIWAVIKNPGAQNSHSRASEKRVKPSKGKQISDVERLLIITIEFVLRFSLVVLCSSNKRKILLA